MSHEVDPAPVITYESRPAPAMHLVVNFGVFTGREVTSLELRRLRETLLELVPAATILSEHRVEFDSHSEAALHQVRIEVGHDALPENEDVEVLRGRLAAAIDAWARACVTGFSGAELTHAERAARDAVVELTAD